LEDTGTIDRGETAWQRARERWGKPLAFALSVVIGVLGIAFFLVAGTQAGWDRPWFDDLTIYTDATTRIVSGDSWYLARQVSGPYELLDGDVLYPPVSAWFFLPWLVLPAWTFAALPMAVIAWSIATTRPAPWTWPIIVFGLVFPITLIYAAYANPTLWIAAFLALGLRFGWPGVLVLLKPSLAPFALVGIRSRGWWIGLVLLGLASLPFLTATIDYPRVVTDARGGSLLYSGTSIPILMVPLVAWLGRTVGKPRVVDTDDQTRPETQ
jgi:hypothetical protein